MKIEEEPILFVGPGEVRDHGYDRREVGAHWVKTGEYRKVEYGGGFDKHTWVKDENQIKETRK